MFGLVVPELEQWLGMRVVPAYGMTETVIHATNDNPGRMVPKGSMGKPTPGLRAGGGRPGHRRGLPGRPAR